MKNTDKIAQTRMILAHLQGGGSITTASALIDFGIASLHRRLSDIKAMGFIVYDKWQKNSKGKRFKVYTMDKVEQ